MYVFSVPLREAVFDRVISIAVTFHFVLIDHGTVFVTAWATNQPLWQSDEPDQMVP
jgi:hypothetical protein